jgi:hypothetical protein
VTRSGGARARRRPAQLAGDEQGGELPGGRMTPKACSGTPRRAARRSRVRHPAAEGVFGSPQLPGIAQAATGEPAERSFGRAPDDRSVLTGDQARAAPQRHRRCSARRRFRPKMGETVARMRAGA